MATFLGKLFGKKSDPKSTSAHPDAPTDVESAMAGAMRKFEAGDYKAAVKLYQRAAELAPDDLAPAIEARLWFESGLAYHKAGSLMQAHAAYDFAIKTYEEHNIPENYSYCLGNWAMMSMEVDRAKALQRLEKAVEVAVGYDDTPSAIYHLGQLAQLYAEAGDPDKAIAFNRRALDISVNAADKKGQIASGGSLAQLLAATGHPAEAIDEFDKVAVLCREVGLVAVAEQTEQAAASLRLG